MNFVKDDITGEVTSILDVLKSPSQNKFFNKILTTCDQNDLVWYSNSTTVSKLAKELDLSEDRIKQLIKNLCDLGVLIKKTRGVYAISRKYITNQSSK